MPGKTPGAKADAKADAKAAGKPASPEKPPPPPPPPIAPPKEEPFLPATVLILGGYGTVGSAMCSVLLEQSSTVKLLVAGRSIDNAQALADQLNSEYPPASAKDPQRVRAYCIDAENTSSFERVPRFDVLVNATTMSAVEGLITLMRFAASKRSHYLDLKVTFGFEEAMAKAVGDVGPIILMGGGYCPGAIAPLLRSTAGKMYQCTQAHISIAATALPSQAEDAIEAMITGTRLEDWHDGRWQPAKPSQPDFGRPTDFFNDGRLRQTTPVGVAEARSIPTDMKMDKCSVRFASTQDGGLMCAAFAVLCCAPCVGLREGIAKHLRAAMERARAREPHLCACVCEASGVDDKGRARKVILRMSHPGGPAAMAAHCAVAQLTQMLTKDVIPSGLPPRLCGTAVNPDVLLRSLITQGVRCAIETVEEDVPSA
jgi:hypothetical protein|eukprot:jgi/Chrpa1/8448/Chrysochromulina_OHIO_Genome00022696-RA